MNSPIDSREIDDSAIIELWLHATASFVSSPKREFYLIKVNICSRCGCLVPAPRTVCGRCERAQDDRK